MAQVLLTLAIAMRLRFLGVLLSVMALRILFARDVHADVVPQPTELPEVLTLDEALRILRTRGLDLLIAEAAVRTSEGGVQVAGAVPNPVVNGSVGNAFTYSNDAYSRSNCLQNGAQCSPWIYNVGLADSAAIEDSLSGKRDLRLKVARNALAAAKMSRSDAERTITFQMKSAYLQLAQAVLAYNFAKQVRDSNVKTLELFETKFRTGAINQGDLARIQTQKLESDQALAATAQTLRQARVALAFLIGVRGEVPEFGVDVKVLDYSTPPALVDATQVGLLRAAFEHRPDLLSFAYQKASAEAQVALTKRQKFPDITLNVNYAWGGYGGLSTNGPLQGPTITFGLSAPIPVFYQLQGELRQAEAQYDTNSLQQAKATAQVVNDVDTAYVALVVAKEQVIRMEHGFATEHGGSLLEAAKVARDVTRLQFEKGGASLTDYLDALRTYIATNVEYFGDLTNYWTAVFQLEEAVGTELHP
jgi:cobalt-zinc-cadmium efflux system outer membrane protein